MLGCNLGLTGYLLFREDRLSSSKLYSQSVDISVSITGTFRQTVRPAMHMTLRSSSVAR